MDGPESQRPTSNNDQRRTTINDNENQQRQKTVLAIWNSVWSRHPTSRRRPSRTTTTTTTTTAHSPLLLRQLWGVGARRDSLRPIPTNQNQVLDPLPVLPNHPPHPNQRPNHPRRPNNPRRLNDPRRPNDRRRPNNAGLARHRVRGERWWLLQTLALRSGT